LSDQRAASLPLITLFGFLSITLSLVLSQILLPQVKMFAHDLTSWISPILYCCSKGSSLTAGCFLEVILAILLITSVLLSV